MNPLVEFLAGGGGLGYRQRKQKEDQEAEMARLFKEQQMKTAKIQQQAAEFQLKQAQQPDEKIIQSPDGRTFVVSKDPNTGQYGQPRPIDQPRQGATAPATVGAGGGMPGIPVPPMRPTGATPGTFPGPTSRGTPGFNPNPTSGSPSFNAPPQWNPNPNEIALISELSPEDQEHIYSLNPTQRAQLLTKANVAKRTRLANEAEAERTRAASAKQSQVDAENQKEADRLLMLERQASSQAGVVLQDIAQAIDELEVSSDDSLGEMIRQGAEYLPGSNMHRGLRSMIGGSDARRLAGLLETIKSNEGFNKLQEIKASSKTGGGVGSLSEKEFENLASVRGKLDIGDRAQTLKNLKRLYELYSKVATSGSNGEWGIVE